MDTKASSSRGTAACNDTIRFSAARPVPPLVFIYDRSATRSHSLLDLRLVGCQNYAARWGWEVVGTWVDLGDHALGVERPQFGELLAAMRTQAERRKAVCLVHNWGRLAQDGEVRLRQQQRVAQAGGWTATTFDESDERRRAVLSGVGCW
ncbi:hypothetical protein ACH4FX_08240 [Streptomyces sp. NPDC018019]|uniref:hypothetical protein n=1 Tax=Streptomyces sp. NPDC018019 TaxID=3365030 RepID=UPI0037ADE7CD